MNVIDCLHISLVNDVYKIIAAIRANQLGMDVKKIILKVQNVFLKIDKF